MYSPSQITSGREAMKMFSALQKRGMGNDSSAVAFDAAGASGMTFLQAQLELINPDLVKPLQATTHARDIFCAVGGGFPQYVSNWASNYASAGTQFYGLQGTNNTNVPTAQIDIQKEIWPTYIWAAGFNLTIADIARMEFAQRAGQPAPFAMQDLYEKSIATMWGKACDYVTYIGWLGQPGLINNPAVPATVAANGGAGTAWAVKTPQQILNDVNFAINQTVQNSGYDIAEGAADSLLLPYPQFAALTQPMTIGGIGYNSTIDYIRKHCVAAAYGVDFRIFPLPNQWISGTGLGSTDRAVFYKNNKDSLYLQIGQPATKQMTVQSTKDGGSYETLYNGCVSCVIFRRTTTMQYLDGI